MSLLWPEPIILIGQFVRLEPTELAHASGLEAASKDGNLHQLWYTAVPRPENVRTEIARRLDLQAKGSMLPFTVIAHDKPVGMTTYMHIDAMTKRLEIGSTWYAKSVQRTPLNTEAKLLLLTHAFEKLQVVAVEFRTHFLNFQSREAITKLGAKQDGILRSHVKTSDGNLRDTVVFSIIASEWPMIKAHLQFRLQRLAMA